jgi:ferrous iron transport protein A
MNDIDYHYRLRRLCCYYEAQTHVARGVNAMTLWDLHQQKSAELTGFHTATPECYRSRLCEIGFDQGEHVTCLRVTPFGGPRVYRIGDGMFSLDRELALQILIKATES